MSSFTRNNSWIVSQNNLVLIQVKVLHEVSLASSVELIQNRSVKQSVHILLLPADPFLLEGGARSPGASFLLAGRHVLLLAHSTASPRLTAVARRHWRTSDIVSLSPCAHFLSRRTPSDSFPLTSDGSQSGDDPGAGRRGGALASLILPLVHAGRRLNCDLMLEAYRWARREKL